MKDPFQLILASQNLNDVISALADLQLKPDEFSPPNLSIQNREITVTWLSHQLQNVGVKSTIYTGGIFFVAEMMGERQERRAVVNQLLGESGISRGHAYQCVRIFVNFNAVFQRDNKLAKHFGNEALKILSAKATASDARGEAIRLAKNGTKISTKLAKELRDKYSQPESTDRELLTHPVEEGEGSENVDSSSVIEAGVSQIVEAEVEESPVARIANGNVSKEQSDDAVIFEGFGFRLFVNTKMQASTEIELAKIVRELEAFLSQLRSQCGNAQKAAAASNSFSREEATHAEL